MSSRSSKVMMGDILCGNPRHRKGLDAMTRLCICAILFGLLPAPGRSQSAPPEAISSHLSDTTALRLFLDSVMRAAMARVESPGAALSLVMGDKIVVLRGYGFADNAGQVPVDPARHMFRIGSITKTFTATGIMQLYDRGLIDLDENVNTYLRAFKLPDTYAEPITIRQLLQHTSGIDNDYTGIGLRSHEDHVPLGEYFAAHVPARIRPPGRVIVYTNRATMLLGHVIEAVSGQSYEDYLHERLFMPLEMTRSVFAPPPELRDDLVMKTPRTPFHALPDDLVDTNTRPSSDLATTALDVAHYMIAHLSEGVFKNSRILAPGTAAAMQIECYQHHPRHRAGRCLGWGSSRTNRQRIIGHGGMHQSFRSSLFLLPDHGVGLFVAGRGARTIAQGVFGQLLTRYFPSDAESNGSPAPGVVTRAEDLVGSYRVLGQVSLATFEKLLYLRAPEPKVRISDDGALVFGDDRFIEAEPLVFDAESSRNVLVFKEDDRGRVTYATFGGTAFRKLRWYETRGVLVATAGVCLLILASAAIGWPLGALARRTKRAEAPGLVRVAAILGWIAAVLWITASVGLVAVKITNIETFFYGLSPVARLPFALARVATVDTLAFVIVTGMLWWHGVGSIPGRAYYTIVVLAALALIPWMRYWHVL